ncbi:MAG: hypothetical protein HY043_22745 [Verrucomicrobia bacterium]|nr:hypothetical protein [Verrucomicrobiota bacterium]
MPEVTQPTPAPFNPTDWLTAKELAGHFGLNEESAYRWRREIIPEVHPETQTRLIRYAGKMRIFFHVDCVSFLEERFAAAHD